MKTADTADFPSGHKERREFRLAPFNRGYFLCISVSILAVAHAAIAPGACVAQRAGEAQPAATETARAESASTATAIDRAAEVLNGMQNGVRAWSADFTQLRHLKTLVRPLKTEGRVTLDSRGNIRWQLGVPARTVALKLPTRMWVVYPRLKRAESFDLRAPGPFKDMLPLLEAGLPGSSVPLWDRFQIESASIENRLMRVRLTPLSRSVRDMMPSLTLEVEPTERQLVASTVFFADGSSMRNEFRNIAMNPELDAGVFDIDTILEPDFEIDNRP